MHADLGEESGIVPLTIHPRHNTDEPPPGYGRIPAGPPPSQTGGLPADRAVCLEIVRGNRPPEEVQMTSPGKSAGDLGCQHPLDSSGIPDRQIAPRYESQILQRRDAV